MQNKLVIAVLVLIAGFIAFCMFFLMERYERTVWSDTSIAAKRNPYLAAQQYLEQRGVTVVETNDILDFESIPVDQTILLTKVDSMLVSPRQVEAALDWIDRGGYMIVGVDDEIEGQTSILKHFDIEPEYRSSVISDFFDETDEDESMADRLREMNRRIDEEARQAEEDLASESETAADNDTDVSEVVENPIDEATQRELDLYGDDRDHEFYTITINDDETIHVAVLDNIILNQWMVGEEIENRSDQGYTLNTWASDEIGQRMLHFYYGEGTFVALSSADLWLSTSVALGDHAYLLSYLVPDDSTLQLFYNLTSPSFGDLLFDYFKELIWAMLAFLCFWLWYRGTRTQRIRGNTQTGRRNFSEHLLASAQYLVRESQYAQLIDTIKQDIEQQLRPQHPNFSQLNDASQVAIITDKTNLSKAAIESWLAYCKQIDSREHFFAAVKIGNAIRKQL